MKEIIVIALLSVLVISCSAEQEQISIEQYSQVSKNETPPIVETIPQPAIDKLEKSTSSTNGNSGGGSGGGFGGGKVENLTAYRDGLYIWIEELEKEYSSLECKNCTRGIIIRGQIDRLQQSIKDIDKYLNVSKSKDFNQK